MKNIKAQDLVSGQDRGQFRPETTISNHDSGACSSAVTTYPKGHGNHLAAVIVNRRDDESNSVESYSQVRQNGQWCDLTFDKQGNQTSFSDHTGAKSESTYNEKGDITAHSSKNPSVFGDEVTLESWEYNDKGVVTSYVYGNKDLSIKKAFNENGDRLSCSSERDTMFGVKETKQTWEYNEQGQVTSCKTNGIEELRREYNESGVLIKESGAGDGRADGNYEGSYKHTFNDEGRPLSKENADMKQKWAYHENGSLSAFSDIRSDGSVRKVEYDRIGNETSRVDVEPSTYGALKHMGKNISEKISTFSKEHVKNLQESFKKFKDTIGGPEKTSDHSKSSAALTFLAEQSARFEKGKPLAMNHSALGINKTSQQAYQSPAQPERTVAMSSPEAVGHERSIEKSIERSFDR